MFSCTPDPQTLSAGLTSRVSISPLVVFCTLKVVAKRILSWLLNYKQSQSGWKTWSDGLHRTVLASKSLDWNGKRLTDKLLDDLRDRKTLFLNLNFILPLFMETHLKPKGNPACLLSIHELGKTCLTHSACVKTLECYQCLFRKDPQGKLWGRRIEEHVQTLRLTFRSACKISWLHVFFFYKKLVYKKRVLDW